MKIKDIIELARPKHWIKNLFIFAPLLFSLHFTKENIFIAILAFIAFSFIASTIYIINDIADKEVDLHHPRKKTRPLPSGRISPRQALVLSLFLFILSIIISYVINLNLLLITLTYFILNLGYSFLLKHIVILDAFSIALGFVLRVIAGSIAISVTPSNWIIITTFFLSLFLGFGKRRNELLTSISQNNKHRKVLESYNLDMLNQIIISTGSITIIAYALYTLDENVIERFDSNYLVYTTIFVAFGIYRYIYQIFQEKEGDPTELVTKDKSIIIATILWISTIMFLIYFN